MKISCLSAPFPVVARCSFAWLCSAPSMVWMLQFQPHPIPFQPIPSHPILAHPATSSPASCLRLRFKWSLGIRIGSQFMAAPLRLSACGYKCGRGWECGCACGCGCGCGLQLAGKQATVATTSAESSLLATLFGPLRGIVIVVVFFFAIWLSP